MFIGVSRSFAVVARRRRRHARAVEGHKTHIDEECEHPGTTNKFYAGHWQVAGQIYIIWLDYLYGE